MVPNYKEWYFEGPWVVRNLPKNDTAINELVSKQSFILFIDGGTTALHELAHFICCKDDDVLDPFWGMGEITDFTPLEELRVLYVEEMLWQHKNPKRDKAHISDESMLCLFELFSEEVEEVVLAYLQEVKKEFPSIEVVYEKHQRKIKLLNELLG